jgi:hypothetical protein
LNSINNLNVFVMSVNSPLLYVRVGAIVVSWLAVEAKSKTTTFATVARHLVEQAIGAHLDGTPLDDPSKGKNPAAVALGKLGGAKGGGEGGAQS